MDLKWVIKLVFWVAVSQCSCCCVGYKFSVGGSDGWVVHPSEDYSHWSHRNRFLVNDTLYFKYKKGEDSVLELTKDDYYSCNTSNWLLKNENGSSEFKLARSGPFFFISGVKDHCDKGQKLLLIVLSEKHRHAAPPAAHPPALPEAAAPTAHPPSVSPSPLTTASHHHPPAMAPSRPSLASSPTPTTHSPAPSPSSSPSIITPPPAVSQVSSPGPSVQSTSDPPPAENIPPTPVPVPSEKAAALSINSALPISIALLISLNLFLGVTM